MLEIMKEKRLTKCADYYGTDDRTLANGVRTAINEVIAKKEFEKTSDGISPNVSLRILVNIPFAKVSFIEYELHIKRVRKCLFKILNDNPHILAVANWEDIFAKAVLNQLFFETLFNEDSISKMTLYERNSYMVYAMQMGEKVYVDKTETKSILSGIFMNLFRGMDNENVSKAGVD